jgi:hypothetical protein
MQDSVDEESGEEEGEDELGEEADMYANGGERKLPSVKDPKLWQVRVKKGQERTATMALMNKMIHFA